MNLLSKNKYILIFLVLLLSHYIYPLIIFNEIIINPHDKLEIDTVYSYITSQIYKGNFDSINYFLSGEIKWYYLERLFFPINILNIFLSDKVFFFTEEILQKSLSYFSFYLLAKSLKVPKLESALGGLVYASILDIYSASSFFIYIMPYVLYLLVNKNNLRIKHYIILVLIGLNSSFAQDIFALFLLIPLSYFFTKKNKNFNFNFLIFFTIFISLLLVNLHLIFGTLFSDIATHRDNLIIRGSFSNSILETFKEIFLIVNFKDISYFFILPLGITYLIVLGLSAASKEKKIKNILYFFILVIFLLILGGSTFIELFFIGPLDILNGINFRRINRVIPLFMTILLIYNLLSIKMTSIKILIYTLSIISALSLQLNVPMKETLRTFLKPAAIDDLKKVFYDYNFSKVPDILFHSNNYFTEKGNGKYETNKTFDKYYRFDDYKYIKNIVKESRVLSVDLDPMVAVMNNIKVIDGYHNIYPNDYKIKFRKIISRELDKNEELKKYYDNWGNRVYAFYNDKDNLLLDFVAAKKIGADYVISSFAIKNKNLEIICSGCNNSKKLFLYKIF